MSAASSGEEHCRACMNVEELMKRARKLVAKVSAENTVQQATPSTLAVGTGQTKPMRSDCPVDTEKLGRSTWDLLHTMAAYYPTKPTAEQKTNAKSLMNLLGEMYPCAHCAEDLRSDLVKHPPDVEDREKFSLWMCGLHNRVNKKLGKTEYDCTKWKERWRDGWKDGSCDY